VITWRLWRALQHPPVQHPLYRRVLLLRPAAGVRLDEALTFRFLWRLALPILFVSIFALTPIILPLIVVSPVLLPLIANLRGGVWAVKTGGAIARENEQGTYDLLALLPFGAFGANWVIGSGCLYRGSSFADLQTFVRILMHFLLLVLGIALVIAIILMAAEPPSPKPLESQGQVFMTLVNLAALIAAFYIDYVQSVIVGILVGMLAPAHAHNRFDTRAWGLFSYLFLQVSTYLITWLIGFQLVPTLYQALNFKGILAEFSLPIFRLAVFYLAREVIIATLWRALTWQLNAVSSDLNVLS